MKRLLCVFVLLAAAVAYGNEMPIESPRTFQSGLTAMYMPSFNLLHPSLYPFYDNYSVSGNVMNCFVKGPNLNFYYGYNHSIQDGTIMPFDVKEITSYEIAPQQKDDLYGNVNYAFFDFFQLNLGVDYYQNRLALSTNSANQDYNYDKTAVSGTLIYDARYSTQETWYKGMTFIYPEEGFLLSAGGSWNQVYNYQTLKQDRFYLVSAEYQQFLHLAEFWVLTWDVSAKSHLAGSPYRAYALTTAVEGAYQTAGDYALDGTLELRFLQPYGLFWESPPFWYINSFLFKFSPGIFIGANGGAAGSFHDNLIRTVQSISAGPLVAVRINGSLSAVLRADFTVAGSSKYQLIFSFNFGSSGSKPGAIAMIPVSK